MEKKNNLLYMAIATGLGLLIVICLIVLISVSASNKIPKLDPKNLETVVDNDAPASQGENVDVSQDFADAVVNVSENFDTESKEDADKEDKDEKENKADEEKVDENQQNDDETQKPEDSAADNTASAGGSADYICPYISDRLITADDMKNLAANNSGQYPGGRSMARMIINDIYAKYGYIFTKQELNDYYGKKSWYKASEKNMDVVLDKMTEIEKKNVSFLETYNGN